jgi:hypothetical protein
VHYQVFISAETKEQATIILDALLEKKLKEHVIEAAREASAEEIPMLSFIPFEGNDELNTLIRDTLGD